MHSKTNSTTRADAHHYVTNFEVDGMIWNKKRNILRANNHFSVKKNNSFYIVIQKLWFQKLSFFGWGNLYLVLSGTFLLLEKAQTEARKKILFNIWTHGSMGMPTPWHKLKKDYPRYNLHLTFPNSFTINAFMWRIAMEKDGSYLYTDIQKTIVFSRST